MKRNFEGDTALDQAAQRGGEVSISGVIQNSSRHHPMHSTLGEPALAGWSPEIPSTPYHSVTCAEFYHFQLFLNSLEISFPLCEMFSLLTPWLGVFFSVGLSSWALEHGDFTVSIDAVLLVEQIRFIYPPMEGKKNLQYQKALISIFCRAKITRKLGIRYTWVWNQYNITILWRNSLNSIK